MTAWTPAAGSGLPASTVTAAVTLPAMAVAVAIVTAIAAGDIAVDGPAVAETAVRLIPTAT
jgi:hypothetical protein